MEQDLDDNHIVEMKEKEKKRMKEVGEEDSRKEEKANWERQYWTLLLKVNKESGGTLQLPVSLVCGLYTWIEIDGKVLSSIMSYFLCVRVNIY